MPCQDCGSGNWECGPPGANLCTPAGAPSPVGTVCHDVYVYRDKDDQCQASIDRPPHGGGKGAPPFDKYRFCVKVSVREVDGKCIVRYKFEPQ